MPNALKVLKFYLHGILRELERKPIFVGAQAIAFKVIVTFVPVVVLGTGLVGQFLQRDRPFQYVAGLVREFFPQYQSDELIVFLQQLQDVSGTLTVIGLIGLLLAALTLFTTLRGVFNEIFREEWHDQRSILKGYLFDFRMVLQIGVFFILSIGITVLLQALDNSGSAFLSEMGVDAEWVREGWRGIFTYTGKLLPYLLTIVVFFQLYFLLPIPRSEVKSALLGAISAATVWEMSKIGFTEYATSIRGFEQGWITPLGDSFLLILVTIFWAYLSGLVLNIGAVITLLHERRLRMTSAIHEQKDGPEFPASNGTPPTPPEKVQSL